MNWIGWILAGLFTPAAIGLLADYALGRWSNTKEMNGLVALEGVFFLLALLGWGFMLGWLP